MKIADISVKRPVGVIIMVMIVMILGAVSLTDLSIDLLPDLELPVAVVLTDYSGAAPQEVENLVTSPLEGTLSTLEGLDTIQSISAPNQSIVFMRFDFGTDIGNTLLDIRDRVDLTREVLPDGSGDPLILKFDPNAFPIMQISLSGERDIIQLTEWAEEVIQPRLERLPGVGQVSLTGRETRAVEVEVDPSQLELYGVHMTDIVQLIGSENVSGSAGTLIRGSQNMSLRVVGEFESADEIAEINVPVASGDTVKLSELADVEERLQTPSSFSYVNGERTLSMDITKQSDANTVDVANAVHAELERIQNSMPERMQLDTVWDSSRFIRESISNVVTTMLIGAVMAVIVLLLFLRSFRSMFVVAASIPIAIISAFTLIYFSGQTLNILTMGGLALGVGLMVDSSIVILENIAKYREQGYPRIEAARKGASEIGGAVIAATLTSIVVFLPIVFTGGIAAEIFMPLALTVTFTLVASLLVALTLVPMLSSKMLPAPLSVEEQLSLWQRIDKVFGRALNGLNDVYKNVLRWSIHHKKTIFFGTLLLLIGSLFLIPMVGLEFLPMFDQGEVLVEVDMPPGTDIEKTEEVMHKIESFLLDYPGMDLVFTSVGGNATGMSMRESGDRGSIYARLLPRAERNITTQQVIDDTAKFSLNIPDADIQVTAMQSAELGEEQVSIEISGNDLNILQSIAAEVEEAISQTPGVANITNSMAEARPELQVIVDRDEAGQNGLQHAEVMQYVQAAFQGQTAALLRTEGDEIEVNVVLPEDSRSNVEDLRNLSIPTPTGESILLSSIADLIYTDGPSVINRQNQQRGVSVTGDIFERDLGSVISDIENRLETVHVPEGYEIHIGGQFEQLSDAFEDLTLALILAIFLVYAVMAIQFEKVMYPFIVMFTLPVTAIGVIIGLVVTGRPLSTPGFVGLIMLSGIVVNNAIVLVDYINTLRERGMDREEAILKAGPERLRPILMTMLTTVLAMTPLAIGFGEGAEMQAPMATVVIFGLSFSTLITLIFVPVMYIYIDTFTNWWKSLFIREHRHTPLDR